MPLDRTRLMAAAPPAARITTAAGALALLVTVVNQLTAAGPDPALQRSSALASLLAVGLMLVGILWTRLAPQPAERAALVGEQGLVQRSGLDQALAAELDWGSRMLLTATPAAVVLLWWQGAVLLQRGLIQHNGAAAYSPGPIARQAWQRGRAIHLVDLRLYPGRNEFAPVLQGLPSVVVQPLGTQGLLLVGGWSARCFSSSDQAWIAGWAARLTETGLVWPGPSPPPGEAAAGTSAPAPPDC
jgi:hypothetical protein